MQETRCRAGCWCQVGAAPGTHGLRHSSVSRQRLPSCAKGRGTSSPGRKIHLSRYTQLCLGNRHRSQVSDLIHTSEADKKWSFFSLDSQVVQSCLIPPLKQQAPDTAISFKRRKTKSLWQGPLLAINSPLSTPVWVSWPVCPHMPSCMPRRTPGWTEQEGDPNAGSTVPSPGVKHQPFCS